MKIWSLFFILCLELLSNTTKAAVEYNVTADQFVQDKDSNKAADRGLVKNIRQELLNEKSISKSGKNVQIIVVNKEITIKGPIPSENEKNRIIEIAEKNSGGHKIRNQLEVIRE